MNSIAIYGASDDLVEIEVDGKPHEELSPPKSFAFTSGTKTLHARLSYDGKKGTAWKLTIELQDEGEEGDLPFDVAIVQERYSPKLIVTAKKALITVHASKLGVLTLKPEGTQS